MSFKRFIPSQPRTRSCTAKMYIVKKVIDHPRYTIPLEVGSRYGKSILSSMGFEIDQPRFKEFFDEIQVDCRTGKQINPNNEV